MSASSGLKLTRRDFLKLTGIVATTAILSKYGVDVLAEKELMRIESGLEYVPNVCMMCSTACDILVASKTIGDRKIAVKIEGDPKSEYNRGKICARGQAGLRREYSPDRIKKPLIRRDPNTKGTWDFEAVSWDEVWDYIEQKIREYTGGDISKVALVGGWVGCVNYRPFMVAMLRRVNKATSPPTPIDEVGIGWINGTPLQHCVFGAGLGIDLTMGVFNCHAEFVADFENSDYILIARSNASVAGVSVPRGERLALAKKKGTKIVVLDPRMSETAALASEWIKIKPGTDPAFLLAMMNVIVNRKLYDEEFLKLYTNSPFLAYEPTDEDPVPQLATDENGNYLVFDSTTQTIVAVPKEANSNAKDIHGTTIDPALEVGELEYNGKRVKTVFQFFKEKIANFTPEWAAEICDIDVATIERIGREFGEAERPTIDPAWYDGRYSNSFMFSKLRAILMVLKGMIDKKGGWIYTGIGRLPLMKWNKGGAPRKAPSLPGFLPVYNLLKLMAWPTPDKVPAMFPAMSDVPLHFMVANDMIKVIIIAGSNPIISMYDKEKWEATLKKTFVITIDVQVSDSMLYSDVVLPEQTYLERVDIVKPNEAFDIELVTRFPATDPPEGVEPKHYFTITAYLLDIFNKVSGKDMKNLWFNKLKGIFGLSEEEASTFDEIVDRNDNENLPYNLQKFFAWLFVTRLNLCEKWGVTGQECTKEQKITRMLSELMKGPIKVLPVDVALASKNIPRNLQASTLTGRIELYSTIMYEVYQIFKNRFGYSPAWDPLVGWPGVGWKEGVDDKWKPTIDNEFFVTHGKVPLMSFTSSTNNDLLLSLVALDPRYYGVWIPKSRAEKLGIRTGDLVKMINTKDENRVVYARAFVTDLIREDTIFIPSNYKWEFKEQRYYKEFYEKYGPFVNLTELLPYQPDPIMTMYRTNEYTVRIEKA